MTLTLYIIAGAAVWYVLGAVGMLLYFGLSWRRTLDVRVDDVIFAAGMSFAGPLAFMCGVFALIGELFHQAARLLSLPSNGRAIVWRRRGA
jgi:hypothetical protein